MKSQEITVLVRFLAIVLIVVGHLKLLDYGGGGSMVLMLAAGLTYSKYIVPHLQDRPFCNQRHILQLVKIGLPAVAYVSLQQALSASPMNWPSVFLFSTYIRPVPQSVWFIEIYLQINLLLLLAAQSRQGARFLGSIQNFGPAVLFFLLAGVVCLVSSLVWDTTQLYHRVVPRLFWAFAAGMLLGSCRTRVQRMLFAALVILAGLVGLVDQISTFFTCAILMLGLLERVVLLEGMAAVVRLVAGASLMIYLTHFQWIKVWHLVYPASHPVLTLVFCLAGGVLLNLVYDRLWKAARARFFPSSLTARRAV